MLDPEESGEDHRGEVNIESKAHNPGGERGTDIGTHNHRYRLGESEKSGVDE